MLKKLEKYEILDEIGHGGMATVYRARDSRLDREVAVKVMHPHLRGAHEARVRFTREAQSVARLKHDNILEIYDNSDPDSEEAYIVTELLTGPTLKVFAEKNREMPAEVAASFAILIAEALGCAHAAGIVHRDVKPENVLLHEDRTLKLTDFGIAQMIDSNSFTATGQILGSPGHMAPEQIEGGSSDQRTDIFALGTVLYYLATGRLPFEGKNPHQVLKRIVDGEYAHPLRVRPTVGGRLSRIIEKALATNPTARYQTAKELEDDLCAFVGEAGIESPAELLARYMTDPAGVTEELRETTIGALIDLGKEATARGEMPLALDYYNRVLSLDDGNEKVLHLIENIGRRDRNKSLLVAAGVVVALGAIGALAYGWGGTGSGRGRPDAGVIVAEGLDAGDDAGAVDATTAIVATVADASEEDTGRSATAMGAVTKVRLPVLSNEPRKVRFRPDPEDVFISVDGGEFREFGPTRFHETSLRPGPHRIVMRGACCEEETFQLDISPASDPAEVIIFARSLRYKPARLYVYSAVPGIVKVNGGSISVNGQPQGATETLLMVSIGRPAMQAQITVTADGYQAYTETVRLTAGGELAPVRAQLVEASGSSP